MMNRTLTALELKVMNILWKKKKAFIKDLLEVWPEEPKPAYNTVSTMVRILEEKGFVDHEAFGRTHQYFPVVTKSQYQKGFMKNVMDNLFSGNVKSMVSALLDSDKISEDELSELEEMIKKAK